ncbi:MAG: F0F1 ATP synthase subunit gamma [Candidatus Omnitrophota bacterium]|nr:F0F1 ATP synthase subunit gamma [Candidatus Omnitrophota bacterium]
MIPIAELKQNLELNKSLGSVIETLKAGSAIQVREFQAKRRASDKLFMMLKECFDAISKRGAIKHPLFFYDKELPSCIILVTSDDGFVGELNSAVINAALEERKSQNDEIVVLGERGAGYFEDRSESFIPFPGISEDIKPAELRSIKKHIISRYSNKRIGQVKIVYPESTSVGSWKVAVTQLLPLVPAQLMSDTAQNTSNIDLKDLLIEPSINSVAEGLVNLWLDVVLYNIFWSSKFSEFGARLMHLEGSEQELGRMKQQLSLQYFKHVHALADRTIREILSARIGLGKAS